MNHPPDLIVQVLPVPNEITGFFMGHYFGAPRFENGEDGARIAGGRSALALSHGFECRGNTLELGFDTGPDPVGPLDLACGAGHVEAIR